MSGFIYFITSEHDQYVKIGWSMHSPLIRMRTLQIGCPECLRLMAYAPGSQDEERRLHKTFEELRYRGEWFMLIHKLRDFVEYLSDGWPRETNNGATRERFEDGLWDVVVTGYDWPFRADLDEYRASANGSLWRHIHPEMAD